MRDEQQLPQRIEPDHLQKNKTTHDQRSVSRPEPVNLRCLQQTKSKQMRIQLGMQRHLIQASCLLSRTQIEVAMLH